MAGKKNEEKILQLNAMKVRLERINYPKQITIRHKSKFSAVIVADSYTEAIKCFSGTEIGKQFIPQGWESLDVMYMFAGLLINKELQKVVEIDVRELVATNNKKIKL